ncbi:MAG: four helix bundle protein [Saprospiraceae bacterium]|nr:four helix bundle protein [Lewinellaceae bacterium]
MKQYNLEERLIDFANLVIDVTEALPATKAANHLGGQLLRSGTSPALNYGEGQSAESTPDFLHKHKIILKELRETQINLKILTRRSLLSVEMANLVQSECNQLVAIFTKSVETTKRKLK